MIWQHPAIAGRHVISMSCAIGDGGWIDSVATCQCGFVSKLPMIDRPGQDQAVEAHWRAVIDQADAA